MKPTYKAVTGTFVVPKPKAPSGASGTYSASAWVGLDGDTCSTAIFQVGVDFTVSGTSVSYDGAFTTFPYRFVRTSLKLRFSGWYEWYPDYVSRICGSSGI